LFKYGSVDKPLVDEIYTLIDDSAKNMSIQDIPVEFGYGTYWEEIYLEALTAGSGLEKVQRICLNQILILLKKLWSTNRPCP